MRDGILKETVTLANAIVFAASLACVATAESPVFMGNVARRRKSATYPLEIGVR